MFDDTLRIGFLLFPNMTLLDLAEPYEALSALPNSELYLVWKTLEPVTASGIAIWPTATFDRCPQLDLICVPGGPGIDPLLTDGETQAFLRRQPSAALYVTSVCTGLLVLGTVRQAERQAQVELAAESPHGASARTKDRYRAWRAPSYGKSSQVQRFSAVRG